MRRFTLCLILILFAGLALAQNSETESETTPDLPNPVILPFRTYHAKWLRYTNAHDG